jgi:hypothetical protein
MKTTQKLLTLLAIIVTGTSLGAIILHRPQAILPIMATITAMAGTAAIAVNVTHYIKTRREKWYKSQRINGLRIIWRERGWSAIIDQTPPCLRGKLNQQEIIKFETAPGWIIPPNTLPGICNELSQTRKSTGELETAHSPHHDTDECLLKGLRILTTHAQLHNLRFAWVKPVKTLPNPHITSYFPKQILLAHERIIAEIYYIKDEENERNKIYNPCRNPTEPTQNNLNPNTAENKQPLQTGRTKYCTNCSYIKNKENNQALQTPPAKPHKQGQIKKKQSKHKG